jgi:hypothetical protein
MHERVGENEKVGSDSENLCTNVSHERVGENEKVGSDSENL